MAEAVPLKRQREEEAHVVEDVEVEDTKRHKSYNQILSLLETEEEVPTQDISSLMSTLEHEISFDSCFDDPLSFTFSDTTTMTTTTDPEYPPSTASNSDFIISDYSGSSSPVTSLNEANLLDEEEDDKEKVIRHLLEASDDELGIPQAEVKSYDGDEDEISGGDGLFFSVCDGDGLLWELEDEAANYYTYLQSELFM